MRRLADPVALALDGALLAVLVTVPERFLPGLGTFARPLRHETLTFTDGPQLFGGFLS